MIRATLARPEGPAIHVAEFLPHEGLQDEGFLSGASIVLPRPRHPDVTEELRLLLIEQPSYRYERAHEYLPGGRAESLVVPWSSEPRTGLLLPATLLSEREWDCQWPIAVLVTPGSVGLPGTAADMAHVAWDVLRRVEPNGLVRLLAAVAFRLEILGPGSSFASLMVSEMGLPPAPKRRVDAEVHGGGPVFDPRCLRWIIQEVAAASVASGWGPRVGLPRPDDEEARDLLARALCAGPLLGAGAPTLGDVLRATWLLHEGFTHHGPGEAAGLSDQVLSSAAALGFGHRPRFGWADRLNQWRRVWEVDDLHPTITSNPAAVGQRHRPSDLRCILWERTGLTVADLMTGALGLAARLFTWVADGAPHLATRSRFAEAVTDRGALSARFLTAVADHLSTDLVGLGRRLHEEMAVDGDAYAGLGSTPTHDTRCIGETPILVLGDDGAWAPLGLALLVERFIGIPRSLAIDDGRFADTRQLGGLIGYMFEAVIADLLQRPHRSHHVLSEAEIVAAAGARAGGDGVIGYDNCYLVVEASVQTLGPHVAQGSVQAVRRRCAEYHAKRDQATKTADGLHQVARHYGRRTPESVTTLVVTDVSLTLNPVVATELRAQRPDRNPKFVCSLEEFERLVELGEFGWSIPQAVMSWQTRPLDVPLSDQLARMARVAGGDERHWRFDLQAWIDAIPVDDPVAA